MKQDLMYFNLNSCYLFFTKLIHIHNFLRYQRGISVVRLLKAFLTALNHLNVHNLFQYVHIELLEICSHPDPNCLAWFNIVWLAKKTLNRWTD